MKQQSRECVDADVGKQKCARVCYTGCEWHGTVLSRIHIDEREFIAEELYVTDAVQYASQLHSIYYDARVEHWMELKFNFFCWNLFLACL